MANVYVIQPDGSTAAMSPVRCKDEAKELQNILYKNPNLLPGEQIDPDNPRRWLLIKKEMPVPDPGTGADRWSVDFLFVDQDAIPTFVECKRCDDTRSRREVIGQMLEYAANGPHYWTKKELRDYAEQSARDQQLEIERLIEDLTLEQETDAFFQRMEDNLREGQLRIIFFLETAPSSLKSLVDFLNRQMERSEVLLVEARQFRRDGMTIVAPVLFGYTEQARQVKRTVTVQSGASRTVFEHDLEAFLIFVRAKFRPEEAAAITKLFDFFRQKSPPFQVAPGSGREPSYRVSVPSLVANPIMSAQPDGAIRFMFNSLSTPEQLQVGQELALQLKSRLQGSLPDEITGKKPAVPLEVWMPKVDTLIDVLTAWSAKVSPEIEAR